MPEYLSKVCEQLTKEQQLTIGELESLRQHIEHIMEIVAAQQNYAKISGVAETLKLTEVVEDALRMSEGDLAWQDVKLVRDYREVPAISVEKHKLLQILVNLIKNAKCALDESGRTDKQMTLSIRPVNESRVGIAVVDNGVGIAAENLERIFAHGFTTRKNGHGFGLHSGALAAKELGGSLRGTKLHGPGTVGRVSVLEPLCGQSGEREVRPAYRKTQKSVGLRQAMSHSHFRPGSLGTSCQLVGVSRPWYFMRTA